MFTGIVGARAEVSAITRQNGDLCLGVSAVVLENNDVSVGESISINGACLTVIRQNGPRVDFDISVETLNRTNFGELAVGDSVNIERSMRFDDRYGGHLVSGHVDGIAILAERKTVARSEAMVFRCPLDLAPFFAEKGSVTVDGVSLTINKVVDSVSAVDIEANIVPHTLAVTTLGELQNGGRVHIEVDLVARYLKRFLDTQA